LLLAESCLGFFFWLLRLVISGGLHADFNDGHGTERDDGIADGCVRYTASQQAGDTVSGPPGARLKAKAAKAFLTFHPNPKYFFYLSHQIFQFIYGALNVGKKDN
jgi:hypothetical protein